MAHDQLFKDVLRTFFHEFLTLFVPSVATHIDPDTITFLDPQTFTDLPQGHLRVGDLVAAVLPLDQTPQTVLVHTEIQSEHDAAFKGRVWTYNVLFEVRLGYPVISVALLPFVALGGIRLVHYMVPLFGHDYPKLDYWQIGLRGLDADDYVGAASVLGAAFAALMRPGPAGRAALKLDIIRRLRDSGLDEARQFILLNMVETYLTLDSEEDYDYRTRARAEAAARGEDNVELTELTWADRLLQEGRQEGRQEGIQLGRDEGRRDDIRLVVAQRFGRVLPDVDAAITTAQTPEDLTALFHRALTSPTEADLLPPTP